MQRLRERMHSTQVSQQGEASRLRFGDEMVEIFSMLLSISPHSPYNRSVLTIYMHYIMKREYRVLKHGP
jgi:hypothetical protein